ncbi:MAG: glycosyl hydrolase family 95 catalytic domain-containing protein, partial [Povalibacter sp.]
MKFGFTLLLLCSLSSVAQAQSTLSLRYEEPASRWTEALPVGNGRLGAMIFGGVDNEHLQLNEATLWSGGPRDWNNPKAKDVLPQVRQAIFAGDYVRADQLAKGMQGPYNESYQPLGDLRLVFENSDSVQDYRRWLDLNEAIATVRYRQGDATYTREVFSSFPDQVIVVRLMCDQPGHISFTASADSPLRYAAQSEGADTLVLTGKAPSHVDPSYLQTADPVRYDDSPDGEGMRFQLRVRVMAQGGQVYASGSQIQVSKADAVTLLLSAATSFNGPDKSPARAGRDPKLQSSQVLQAASQRSIQELRDRHVKDYRSLFARVRLDLGAVSGVDDLTTPRRLQRFASGEADPGLATLLYQYGRYLLIASSRPGGLPANLQGIWNDSVRPPWSSNWTLNINTEMNYWPAEVANLAELHQPLFDFIDTLVAHGRETASVNYGARGWVAHHNADIWGQTAPVGDFGQGDPVWANWGMSAPWLSQHLWEHYAFSGDRVFLRERAWPVMKAAAEFCLDWLIEDGHGHLVTA